MWKRLVNDAGCILADTMGLGKTIQSIAVIDCFMRLPKWRQGEGRPKSYETNYTRAPLPRVLVAVPKSLLQNWNAELDRWVQKGDNIYTVLGAPRVYKLILRV
jgi:SNF2 family DNA or RNA helicase